MIKGLRYMMYMKRLREPSSYSFKRQRLLAVYSDLRDECREDGDRVFLNAW